MVEHDRSLWIMNETRENVSLTSRELFGFNVGSFSEVPAGLHGSVQPPYWRTKQPAGNNSFSQILVVFPDPMPFSAGYVSSLVDQIGWSITSDTDVVCLLDPSAGAGAEKKLMTLAEAVANITKTRGATEASMVDHDMTPKTKVRPKQTWLYVTYVPWYR